MPPGTDRAHLRGRQGREEGHRPPLQFDLDLATRVVFRTDRKGMTDIAVTAAKQVKALADAAPGTDFQFEYSPEASPAPSSISRSRSATRSTTSSADGPKRIILNLPATVEMATPNIYADQFEWFGGASPTAPA